MPGGGLALQRGKKWTEAADDGGGLSGGVAHWQTLVEGEISQLGTTCSLHGGERISAERLTPKLTGRD
ncbi:hypothetical protein TYRP_007171 [Tyrophagus putrescentiae]|nr:hypothetical protein TYRP_007171 [Tyrophagus putrescentiae]